MPQKQGRHRYYRLATPQVGRMLESIMAVAVDGAAALSAALGKFDEALRHARTCYDHFAGRLGVGLADALIARGHVVLGDDGGEVTRRASISSTGSASTSPAAQQARAPSAGRASTGPSGGRISPARSARRSRRAASTCAGSSACATAAR